MRPWNRCCRPPLPYRSFSTRLSILFGAGYIESLAQASGNITGFLQFEYSLSGRWLEQLKEVAPHVRHVAVLRDPPSRLGLDSSPSSRRWHHRLASVSKSSKSVM